jgi:tetratricopeptide (TPR) repeat protein
LLFLALFASCVCTVPAQDKKQPPAAQEPQTGEPPEEDEGTKVKEYTFNPLQAQKELNIGNFYAKKGSWRAAAMRFSESVKWNPGFADGFLRLGEARERLGQKSQARDAYEKFLELAPDHKRAGEIKKRMASLPAAQSARGNNH